MELPGPNIILNVFGWSLELKSLKSALKFVCHNFFVRFCGGWGANKQTKKNKLEEFPQGTRDLLRKDRKYNFN